jgi:hypothetical protein
MQTAYQLIKDIYSDKTANRSKVPLISHIDEGLKILDFIGASDIVKSAYCLHPILQSDIDFVNNKGMNFSGVETEAIILTMEYRRVANSYLSHNKPEEFVGFSCDEVKQMLIADKVQNYKDFLIYHSQTHPRKEELDYYFNKWFQLLEIDYNQIVKSI